MDLGRPLNMAHNTAAAHRKPQYVGLFGVVSEPDADFGQNITGQNRSLSADPGDEKFKLSFSGIGFPLYAV